MWHTPVAQDWKDGYDPAGTTPTNGYLGRQAPRMWKDGKTTSEKVALNPQFVETIMGLEIGWTDYASSVTESASRKRD